MSSKFEIPFELRDQLRDVENPDERPGEAILESINRYVPVTSVKNVWAFWHSGLTNMPAWCQRNICDWVRINGPSWTVRILDSVPDSPNFALNYLPAESLPEAFVKGTMDGPYVGPHSSDFLRGACLYHHGGVNMDLGDPTSPYQIAIPWMYGQTIANHFVAARKGDPFIQRWHDLLVHLWKGRTNHSGLLQDPLVAFAQEASFDDSRASNFHWDFKVPAQTVFEYITQVIAWQRLCHLEDAGDGFSGVDYWTEHILLFDVLTEHWAGELSVGWKQSGQRMFDLFGVSTHADPESGEYKRAYELTWRLLTRSSLQKITHGKGLTHDVHLGVRWDAPENKGKDREPGTFAELLRYGAVHFQQTREKINYVQAPRPDKTMEKGVLEP